jgi:hypothetical protein
MEQGRRDVPPAETLFYELRMLPNSAQDEILAVLRRST